MDTTRFTPSLGHAVSGKTRQVRAGWRARWLLLAMALLVGMAPLIASPGAAGAAQNPNKPVELPVDETFPAPNLTAQCGFPVTAHVFGTFTFNVQPSGVELWRIRYDHVFSGPGGSVSVNHIENVKFTSTTSPDGTIVDTITATGTLLYHNVLPGHGSIGNNSGREIIQITWQYDEASDTWVEVDFQVIFDSGPNDGFSDEDFALICAELA